jgi:rsbT co-antagonist protein RsbR
LQRVIDAFYEELERNSSEAVARVFASGNPFYVRFPPQALLAAVIRATRAVGEDLGKPSPVAYPELMGAIGAQRSAEGATIGLMLDGMKHGFEAVSASFRARFRGDPEAIVFWESERARIGYAGSTALAEAYFTVREQIVRQQSKEILELSVRVLPLFRGVLLLPLVGRLDAGRAERIQDVLLAAVAAHAARVVILDVTGLPDVDAEVASHLVRAAAAVRLLGASAALTGVRSALAFAMARGGVDLGGLVTLAKLEDGLHYAMGLVGSGPEAERGERRRR